MQHFNCFFKIVLLALCFWPASIALAQQGNADDPGWPRVVEKGGRRLAVHQPQVDSWQEFAVIRFRSVLVVKESNVKEERFGVLEVEARTIVNDQTREVTAQPVRREIRFVNLPESEEARLRDVVNDLLPQQQTMVVSLDRVLAYLEPGQQPVQPVVDVNLQPPRIFFSSRPAILLMFLGKPELKPVAPGRSDLMFAVNANWDLILDTADQNYYLLNGTAWLTATDPVKGPWNATTTLPAVLSTLPEDANWLEVRKNIPTRASSVTAPAVFATTEPAELLLTDGEPRYKAIAGTKLMQVVNTDSPLFFHNSEQQHYFLVAGRWFRAAALNGPWTAASADLPADFATIPDDSEVAFVKASVPGTREAADAVLLASVPTATSVSTNKTKVTEKTTYNGPPDFRAIPPTMVSYAVNTPSQVFLVDNGYYWCNQGTWLVSTTPTGPWAHCAIVPAAIYTIPPSHPAYNVTYVRVQSATPTTIVYSQTSGYSGEYVAATGVVMFGMGMAAGAIIANNHQNHYGYPPPCYYSYGRAAVYHHGYGGYVSHYAAGGSVARAQIAYGPYGGAGRTAAYNQRTGTYSRSAYATGPGGSAGYRQAYNPRTGTYAERGRVETAAGSAGRFYAGRGNQSVRGGSRSGAYGSAAAIQGSSGVGAAGWKTAHGQGHTARDQSGNVYAGRNGNVYKKNTEGNWSQRSGGSWESVPPPSRSAKTRNLEGQAQARYQGNRQNARVNQARAAGGRRR
jgi:hypothetical protein